MKCPFLAGADFLHDQAVESFAKYYDIHWPARRWRAPAQYPAARERPRRGVRLEIGLGTGKLVCRDGTAPVDRLGFNRPGQLETARQEHKAVRTGVALIDMSPFTKFEISGPDATAFLQYLAGANVDKPVGGAAYTQLCNALGGIEADSHHPLPLILESLPWARKVTK
ncbi:MAG: hypothetical protein L3J36_12020 [Rhodobacteraceae bacterium]|nr:hypothetical protein [Paracoccaceae bacterium]